MGRYGTMLVGPIVFAIAVSGCYTQFGATREETYAEEPEYELYEDSAAYAEEYAEEGYEEARERFYFDYYYPTFSVGFSVGGPWFGGWHYAYYDPYWWGPSWFYSSFWSPWCWYPAYYYPVSCGYYGYPYAWHYSSYPAHSPGVADIHTRTRGFGNTRTTGGNRDFGGTSRDGRRDPNIVLAGGAYRSPRATPAAVDRPSGGGGSGRTDQDRQPVAGDRRIGLDREVTAPGRSRPATLRKFGSTEPVRLKIRKSGTASGSSRVKSRSGNSGSSRTYRPGARVDRTKDPIRAKIRRSTPSGSSRVKNKSGNSGSKRTYKPSSSRSSKPRTSYGGSRGSARSRPSGGSRSGSAPRSSGGSRRSSRR